MQDFRKLRVWHRAQALAAKVHIATESQGGTGQGAWRSQLRRASGSIAANIAEGAVKGTARHFAQYIETAIGSASETESHLDFGLRIGAIGADQATPLIDEAVQIRRMLIVLRRRVLEAPRDTK